jgi:hypothetical protein
MAVPEVISKLIERFDLHRQSYISPRSEYNETKLRQDYLDHFFIALGWDVYNTQGWSEQAREVSLEQPIKIQGTTDFIDYSFKIGKDLKFIAEAKNPRVRIKDNTNAVYQVRRYAWNAKQSLCILTNFDEFAIYDCTKRPSSSDAPAVARIDYFTFKDLPAKWDGLVTVFSKDAVFKGSFDRFAETTKGKKGTASVDDEFLTEIENWRDTLAKNIALRNTSLSVEELNYSVQTIIDRIIFLRICEDRGLESYETLKSLLDTDDVYIHLCELFRKADTKYNSGIFYFEKDPDREEPDTLTLSLKIDDKVLKSIIKRLYYPESPYEFSIIPTAILGHVYEQFLGKIIRLTEGHQARVEYKPEVKKAGGVFYTPRYIVEYIVRHTVEELLKDKTPREISQIRILDPACGSGSFLLGAYQSLLDWHLEWYIKNLAPLLNLKVPVTDAKVQVLLPEPLLKKKKSAMPVELPIYPTGYSNGIQYQYRTRSDWALSTTEKKRILLNNIFGVDIDHQAVEVTKLSLLLKVLEGENEENIDKQIKLFAERALPSLHQNIKCGNSLIGMDILTPEMSSDEVKQINPFDWGREFSDIMNVGGFDVVIGNPPYIRIQRIDYNQSDYLYKKYSTPTSKTDISIVFIEKAAALIKKSGIVGLICSSQWMSTDYGKNIRRFLSDGKILEIINFGSLPVFQKANTYPAIFILNHHLTKHVRLKKITSPNQLSLIGIESEKAIIVPIESLSEDPWNFGDINIETILNSRGIKWKDFSQFGQAFIGVLTGMDEAFVVDKKTIDENKLETKILYPYAYQGAEVFRYCQVSPSESVIYPYNESKDGIPLLIEEKDLKIKYPNIYRHLLKFKSDLQKRLDSRKLYAQGAEWFRHLRPGSFNYIRPKKFIIKGIDKFSKVGLLDANSAFNGANCPGIILNEDQNYSPLYFLGLLNSKVLSYHLRMVCPPKLSGYCRFNSTNVNQLPIRTINFTDHAEKTRHDKMVTLVTQTLDLNKKLQAAKLDHEKTLLFRQIEATDAAIDKLVYELYGLTEEEIMVVEGS